MPKIAINVDIAEGSPHDEALLDLATQANICCGAHAGSPELARSTARLARAKGVAVGAHPGYPDPDHFGRRPYSEIPPEIHSTILPSLFDQTALLAQQAAYLKPHGALYNDSVRPGRPAEILASLLARFPLPLLGLPGTLHPQIAAAIGVPFWPEAFADRRTQPDGTLVPRSQPHAILTDPEEIRRQILLLAPTARSFCVHGDGPDPLPTLKLLRKTLHEAGYTIT